MDRVRFGAHAGARPRTHDAHLRARGPRVADAFAAEVARVVALLAEHPPAGPAVEGRPYRFFVTRRYRYKLVTLVEGEDVKITDVLHPRQAGP